MLLAAVSVQVTECGRWEILAGNILGGWVDGQKRYVEGKCFFLTCRNPSAPWKVTRPLQKVRAAVLRDRLKEVRLVKPRQPSTHVAASVADQQQQQQRPHLVLWQVPVP